jgi:mannitol-1-/sugar-/sorbitol-6-phosphatase
MRTDGVLFDLDGVLVNSTPCLRAAWFAWAERAGVDAASTFALGCGRTTLDHLRLAAPGLATAEQVAALDELEEANVGLVRAAPGALAATAALPASRWGVVTSCARDVARARLRVSGLPEPAVLVTADDVDRAKPAPDGYRRGCADLAVAPEHVLVFEDSPAGVSAAHTAGCRVIAIGGAVPGDDPTVTSDAPDLSCVRLSVTGTRITVDLG